MLLVVWLVESDSGIESDSDVEAVLCVVSWSDNGIESESDVDVVSCVVSRVR